MSSVGNSPLAFFSVSAAILVSISGLTILAAFKPLNIAFSPSFAVHHGPSTRNARLFPCGLSFNASNSFARTPSSASPVVATSSDCKMTQPNATSLRQTASKTCSHSKPSYIRHLFSRTVCRNVRGAIAAALTSDLERFSSGDGEGDGRPVKTSDVGSFSVLILVERAESGPFGFDCTDGNSPT